MAATATPKQISYITALTEDLLALDPEAHVHSADDLAGFSKANASALIDALKARITDTRKMARQMADAAADVPTQEGIYSADGVTIWRVRRSQAGNLYAQRLDPGHPEGPWVYTPGGLREHLAGCKALSFDEARKFGKAFGYCFRCGLILDDPISVVAGMGETCCKNEFGQTRRQMLTAHGVDYRAEAAEVEAAQADAAGESDDVDQCDRCGDDIVGECSACENAEWAAHKAEFARREASQEALAFAL